MESHLLQMRGLKQILICKGHFLVTSHLLQMRGLKPKTKLIAFLILFSRIFYRCVD